MKVKYIVFELYPALSGFDSSGINFYEDVYSLDKKYQGDFDTHKEAEDFINQMGEDYYSRHENKEMYLVIEKTYIFPKNKK